MTDNQTPNITCPGGTLYTIKQGDSYFGLANRFKTTINALIRANPGVNPQNLKLGQQICIPVPPTTGPCPGGFLYIIQVGDTYFSIAKRFGIVVPALADANPGVNPNKLMLGQSICVPAPKPVTCLGTAYSILAGDTLFSIALKFNTTVNAILAENPGINPRNLEVGQVICIPK